MRMGEFAAAGCIVLIAVWFSAFILNSAMKDAETSAASVSNPQR